MRNRRPPHPIFAILGDITGIAALFAIWWVLSLIGHGLGL